MTDHAIAEHSVAENARPMAQVARDPADAYEHALEWTDLARIAFVAGAAAAVWFGVWEPIHQISVIGVIGLMVGGWPILTEAFENILARRMTMELSMTIAIVAAAATGEFFTALVITLFVLIAEVLEGMTVSRGRRAIRDLLDFLPRTVSVRRASGVLEIDVDELEPGDAVLVNPGGRVPVDGIVLSGHSYLDQSRITGESMPVEKTAGASVYAGSINQSGAIEIRVDRIGRDTSFGKIIEAVERADKVTRAGAAARGPDGWLSCVFCARCGGPHIPLHPRYSLDDFGRHRSRRLWDCRRHPACNSGRYWARGTTWRNH
jgi:Cd2+/Zn2+-exporting ATPase/Cu+-exporting ATPase